MKRSIGWAAVSALALATVACGRADDSSFERSEPRTMDVEGEPPTAEMRAPGIVPTAAPGVAFTYRYGFRLPDDRVSAVQEVHAAACEQLGLARCRITGMTFELDDHDRVHGSLSLAVDPLAARAFGKDAIAAVEKEEGRLRYARIDGEDQNPVLDAAATQQAGANSEIAKLEGELAKAKTENERVQLREQLRRLREQVRSAQQDTASAEAKVQRTPMTFEYAGTSAAGRGFAGENPARDAWYMFVDSVATMVSVVLKIVAVILPWALLLALVIVGLRSRFGAPIRRWWNRTSKIDTE